MGNRWGRKPADTNSSNYVHVKAHRRRGLQVRVGLVHIPQMKVSHRPLEIRARIGRVKADSIVKIADGSVDFLSLQVRGASSNIGVRFFRFQLHRLLVICQGGVGSALRQLDLTPVEVGGRVLGRQADGAVAVADGLAQFSR